MYLGSQSLTFVPFNSQADSKSLNRKLVPTPSTICLVSTLNLEATTVSLATMTKILVAYLTIDTLSILADAMAVHLVDIEVKNQTKVTAIKVQAAVGTRTAHRIVCPWKILTKTVDMDDEDHTRKGGHGDRTRSRKSGNEITKLLLTG